MDSSWLTLAVGGVAGAMFLYVAQRELRRLRLRRRFKKARAGERQAEALLRRAGYRIEGRQVSGRLRYRLDGEPVDVEVRADLLVRRRRKRYVAEVKTGLDAPKLTTSSTRRQLLEYNHAFEVDGLLLVDAERGRIHRVEVPTPSRRGGLLSWLFAPAG